MTPSSPTVIIVGYSTEARPDASQYPPHIVAPSNYLEDAAAKYIDKETVIIQHISYIR